MENINDSGFNIDFEIIIFDEKIQCSKFVASFLSPKISKLLRADITLDHFSIDIPTESIYYKSHEEFKTKLTRTNFIHKLKKLLEGEPIKIHDNEKEVKEICELLFEFGVLLENEDMIHTLIQARFTHSMNDEITIENVKEILEISRLLNNVEEQKKALDFISRHFYCILDEMKIEEFRKDELDIILSSDELKINSEDWLFDTILKQGRDFYFLIDYVNVEYLTNEKMQELIDKINEEEITLHRPLWESICRRLVSEGMKPEFNNNRRIYNQEKNYQKTTKEEIIECSEGIIEKLRQESKVNNNPYESKLIEVETTKINDGEIKNLFDKSKNTHLRLANQQNGFILLDFKDKRVNFSKYYFSVPESVFTGRPKSWIIEGSNDKQTWENIDNKENDFSINDYGKSNTFTCQNITNKFYRFIRIKEVLSHNGSSECHNFMLSELEMYGKISKE